MGAEVTDRCTAGCRHHPLTGAASTEEKEGREKKRKPHHVLYRSCDFKASPETTRDCILVLTVSIGCAKNDSAPPDKLPARSNGSSYNARGGEKVLCVSHRVHARILHAEKTANRFHVFGTHISRGGSIAHYRYCIHPMLSSEHRTSVDNDLINQDAG